MGDAASPFVPQTAEFRHPIDRTRAGHEFLRAIQRRVCDAVEDFHATVFVAVVSPRLRKHRRGDLDGPAADPAVLDDVLASARPAFEEWANRWRLFGPPDWPAEAARPFRAWLEHTLVDACVSWHLAEKPNPAEWQFTAGPAVIASLELPPEFTFSVEGWAMLRETAAAFRTRVKEQCCAAIEQHIAERAASASGWEPQPYRLPPGHFDALALYQLRGWTMGAIARHFDLTRRAVSTGIHAAAAAVIGDHADGWLRPAATGGRPRKDRSDAPRRRTGGN